MEEELTMAASALDPVGPAGRALPNGAMLEFSHPVMSSALRDATARAKILEATLHDLSAWLGVSERAYAAAGADRIAAIYRSRIDGISDVLGVRS